MIDKGKERPKGSRRKKVVIIVAIASIAIIGVGAYAYNQIFLNHPLIQYAEAERKTVEKISGFTEKYHQEDQEISDRLNQERSLTQSSITADYSLSKSTDEPLNPMFSIIQGFLSSTEIKLDTYMNPDTLESTYDMELLVQSSSLLEGTMFQSRDVTAVQSDMLFDRAIGINNNHLGDFLQDTGEQVTIEEMPNFVELQQQSVSNAEANDLTEEYLGFIGKEMSQQDVNIEEDVEYEGKSYGLFTLEMKEEEVKELLDDLLGKMKNDDRINAQLNQPFIENDENPLETLQEEINQLSFPEGFTYRAYYNNEHVAHRELIGLVEGEEDSVEISMTVDTFFNDKDQYDLEAEISLNTLEDDMYFVINYDSMGSPEAHHYHIDRRISVGFEDSVESGALQIDWNTTYQDEMFETDFLILADTSDPMMPQIEGTLVKEFSLEANEAAQNYRLNAGFQRTSELEQGEANRSEFGVRLDQTILFGDEQEYPTFNEEDVLKIDELSQEELDNLWKTIEQNADDYYDQLLGNFLPF
ncbi:hypothetical protein CEY16_00335 [Halalkalibacillus sediminis]|uniref:Uncharacterized protein n=1 Tax=Halalkalibacillus sediminis TaxID=2018042 RepID=A0A2I0QV71_9BACI|nr:DUF6583 family protein [Halalkalibacillus sediminis]PKR78241.1 hypothetical protein CEY16_00335 [Halalkalibacillus sediminis]